MASKRIFYIFVVSCALACVFLAMAGAFFDYRSDFTATIFALLFSAGWIGVIVLIGLANDESRENEK